MTRARGMLACPVCHMVLSTAGNCPLCGSAVQDDERPELSPTSTPEVGIPFGLGEDKPSEELNHLPFGIEDAPDASSAAFLETEAEEDSLIEPNSRLLLFGLDDAPSENVQNSGEKAPVESRNPSLELPYGIDHMHHTPID